MASRVGNRGPEKITVTSLGNGTRSVSTVPGDGRVKSDCPNVRNERSAANYGKPQEERFGR